jgi:FtsZ-binding cell division protein ZapB
MNVKVQSMIQEMKSLQLVIDILQEEMNWLKKEHKQDVSSGTANIISRQ